MLDATKKIVGRQLIHSCHLKNKQGSSIVVKERVKYEDGTTAPNLIVYDNPKRSFYVTQPCFRTYKFKPEFELLSRLDKITCTDHEMSAKIASMFEIGHGHGYIKNSVLFKSPYIFGADISIEALIKMRYMNLYPEMEERPSVGFFDIETSIETDQINLISYGYGNKVFTAILQAFFYENVDGTRREIKKEDLTQHIEQTLASRIGDTKYEYEIEVFDSEIKVIAWIMQKVHQSEIDFIGIWNMNFDIPKVLDRLKFLKYSPLSIFPSPSLDRKYRYLKYYVDEGKVQHFTLKWHWLYSTCGSQFIDSMGLFSQCRKTAGYRDRYTLESILNDELNIGKLGLTEGSHIVMQRDHFKDYIVYNIFDVISLMMLEKKNNDVLSMYVLCGPTPVSKFARMTQRSTNSLYHALLGKGMVLSSASSDDDFIKLDKFFPSHGGAVLPPMRCQNVGVELTI